MVKPKACIQKSEWPKYWEVIVQKREVHEAVNSGEVWVPTVAIDYADRVSYLEGVCKGIAAYRND
jgi:hypothetical protein